MHLFVQGVVLGILTGGVYALMASGQTLIFGIMRVVNLAQGALVILGAYLSYSLFTSAGIDPFVSILITTPLMFGLGAAIQLLFLRRLHPADVEELSLLLTFAVALGIEGTLSAIYKTTYRSTQVSYANDSITLAGIHVPDVRLYAFALSIAALGALQVLLRFSGLGRAIRATVQNPTSARLLGVNTARVAAIGFGLGAATAAAAGAVYGIVYAFNSGSHYDLISQLLTIVVLGGLGSVGGAVAGAMIMGVTSSVVATMGWPAWSDFSFFVVLLAILVIRPRGLFGVALRGAA